MKIKITANSNNQLRKRIENVLLTASVIMSEGFIPNNVRKYNNQQAGYLFYRDGDRFVINGYTNNDWANIRSETETEIILEFNHRYGWKEKNRVLSEVVAVFFGYIELIN